MLFLSIIFSFVGLLSGIVGPGPTGYPIHFAGEDTHGTVEDPGDTDSPRILVAQPVDESISIDGVLNEESWTLAAAATDFIQFEPVEGGDPSQKTEVRILYGNNSVYIGAHLFDTSPDEIWSTLGRRDEFNRADWFFISIDSYLNRKSAYTFGVNAAGIQRDGVTTRELNSSWDAVWDSSVRVTADGWIAELRIPYSMLRFSSDDIQSWGLNFTRIIPRTGETLEWVMIPRTDRQGGVVSRYGELRGLSSLRPRRNIQVTPYSVSQVLTEEGDPGQRLSTGNSDFGADLKIGLSSNVILDATVNPDFGQVDSDPAELNLTAFETFFREQRPFFVEGSSTLNFSLDHGSSLLYTRRIGASSPVIAATKLSGRSNSGLSFNMLGAATGDHFDPSRYYAISRAKQEIGKYSSVGAAFTVFDKSLAEAGLRSLSGGADWDIRLDDNRYKINGMIAVTDRQFRDNPSEDQRGFAAFTALDKIKGAWSYSATIRAFDDAFNPNDLGRLRQNNFIRLTTTLSHQLNDGKPVGKFRRASVRFWNFKSWTYKEGLDRGHGANLGMNLFTNSYQKIDASVSGDYFYGGYDVNETRGLLPYKAPRKVNFRFSFETDSRRQWQVKPGVRLDSREDGTRGIQLSLDSKWNVGSRLNLSAKVSTNVTDNQTAWVSNESFRSAAGQWQIADSGGRPDSFSDEEFNSIANGRALDAILAPVTRYDGGSDYYVSVFGKRDTRTTDFTLRSSVTFSPNLSLQFYGQLFLARGRYNNFSVHQDRNTLVPFEAYPKRHDFAFSSVQTNTVLRWEYRPGSTIFLVWTHSRRGRNFPDPLDSSSASPFDQSAFDQISDTFGVFPQNVFLIKLNYLFLN